MTKPILRQKSNAIGTDNTGAAVRTINHILHGITNSVNRLSEISSNLVDTPRPKAITVALSPRASMNKISELKKKSLEVLPPLAADSCTLIKSRIRGPKRKGKNATTKSIKTSSRHTLNATSLKPTTNKVEKKTKQSKNNTHSKSLMLDRRSSIFLKKRYFNKLCSNNLVEIYHNDAVKNSDSDEFHSKKNVNQKRSQTAQNEIPRLDIEFASKNVNSFENVKDENQLVRVESKENKVFFNPPEAPRTLSYCYSKNYELPTVASKMKQVARSYIDTFNFKAIPFCAATSITQSHNIGINIQQVMNIVKNKQSINGISPTLAHNIGLAAEKMHNKPFSDIVSSITSKFGVTSLKCPLASGCLNLHALQEQAKTIPEEDIQEIEEENVESPDVNTVVITGPSGDIEIKNKKITNWTREENSNEQCTCGPQAKMGTYQDSNRFTTKITTHRTIAEPNIQSQILEKPAPIQRRKVSKYSNVKSRYMPKTYSQEQQSTNNYSVVQNSKELPKIRNEQIESDTPGNERTLKEVLMNLHQDFEELNKKYEDLSQKTTLDGNQEAVQELELLEDKLTKKEEEITMVMTLYKEVLALKQQVKILKEKRSEGTINVGNKTKQKYTEHNNPEAACHLTKLLRKIQQYQRRYKLNSESEFE